MKLLRIAKLVVGRSRTTRGVRFATCALYVSTACCAGAMQAHRTEHSGHHVRTSSQPGDKAAADTLHAHALASSPGSAEAMHANVILTNGSLSVEANNSDLSEILRKIADLSGMTIDGSVKSVRVYGTYGPSNARNVLTDLLTGLGYNFMMIGVTHEGGPRKLELTLQSGGSTPQASTPSSGVSDHHENTDAPPPDEEQPGPGAILHVPPSGPDDPQERTRQNLQRLQQMHDQQKPAPAPQ